jgi:tRNA-2-methylthio-N6-dimethylallyladenosine synthase
MENQIPKEIQNKRFDRLLALQNKIALEKNLPLVGKTVRVLCDGESKNNSKLYSGRTESSKIVFFEGAECDTGNFVNVEITRAEPFALYGKKI